MDSESEALKIFAAAREAGVSSGWLRTLLWEGKIPGAYKDSTGAWRVPQSAIEELKRRRESAVSA